VNEFLDWQLVHGTLPAVLTAVGAIAGLTLLIRRDRRWWLRVVPFVAGTSVLVTALIAWIVDELWQPFPDKLPLRVIYWVGVALFAIGLAIAGNRNARWWRRGGIALAVLLVLVTTTVKINAFYGYYPSMRAALGLPPANEISFASLMSSVPPATNGQPPAAMPANGAVTQVPIPSPQSKFPATRNAYVYIPPAYQANPRPLLPVLVLLHGQPGGPPDWINGGQIAAIMDRFAAAHKGIAPVVVMPDSTGSPMANPLCVDGKQGNSETYLAKDVPDWIRHNLQVDPDPKHWAIGGFSYGGTCSLQLALRNPEVYPSFLDLSGQAEPTLGSRARTVKEIFGGDEAAFHRNNPADLLAGKKFPGMAGVVTVGAGDPEYKPQQQKIFDLCRRNGLDTLWFEVPGTHNWQGWAGGFEASLDWLAKRLGLVKA
jgi:S-formylglutathione hydrolase FrmB